MDGISSVSLIYPYVLNLTQLEISGVLARNPDTQRDVLHKGNLATVELNYNDLITQNGSLGIG